MKKLFILAAMIFGLATISTGQTVQLLNPSATSTLDTATNAGTMYLAGRVTGAGTAVIQLNVTKVSGTVAGSASIQASIDNSTNPASWFAVPGSDTLTLADASQVKAWTVTANALHYRVKYTTTGTQKSTPKAYILLKKTN